MKWTSLVRRTEAQLVALWSIFCRVKLSKVSVRLLWRVLFHFMERRCQIYAKNITHQSPYSESSSGVTQLTRAAGCSWLRLKTIKVTAL